jgi:hypothetical protein
LAEGGSLMISGWLALSSYSRVDSTTVFPSLAGYRRRPVRWSGSPNIEEQPRMEADDSAVPGHLIRHAGVFDDEVAGYCLQWFKVLPEYIETPAALPQTTMLVTFESNLLHAINSTTLYGGVSECARIERGDFLGRANGQPIRAGVRLVVADGRLCRPGSLAKRPALAENVRS